MATTVQKFWIEGMIDGKWQKCFGPSERTQARRSLMVLLDFDDDKQPEPWMAEVEDWRLSEPEEHRQAGPPRPTATQRLAPTPSPKRTKPKAHRPKTTTKEIVIRVPRRKAKK